MILQRCGFAPWPQIIRTNKTKQWLDFERSNALFNKDISKFFQKSWMMITAQCFLANISIWNLKSLVLWLSAIKSIVNCFSVSLRPEENSLRFCEIFTFKWKILCLVFFAVMISGFAFIYVWHDQRNLRVR